LQRYEPQMKLRHAYRLWKIYRERDIERRIVQGWTPNIVTGLLDVLPISNYDLRGPALIHDILYLKGGDGTDRQVADYVLYAYVRKLPGYVWYIKTWAVLMYIAVRLCGWRHFTFKKREGLKHFDDILKEVLPDELPESKRRQSVRSE